MRYIHPLTVAAALCVLGGIAPQAALAIPHADAPVTDASRNSLISTSTLLRIAMKTTVSSAHNKAGDTFAFTVMDNVMAGDRVAIPAGTPGTGKVIQAAPAHGGRVDGILHVQFDPIKLAGGTEVSVGITRESLAADENDHNGAAGSLAEVADMTVPGFFLIDFLRKGSDVTLGAGAPFHVAVTQDAFLPPQ